MILCVDGGGSKLIALLMDEEYNIVSIGRSGGVNTTQGSVQNTRNNVKECLASLFTNHPTEKIDHIYAVFVGPFDIFEEELSKYCKEISNVCTLGEGQIGNLSVGFRQYGICANAGTGSDVFYQDEEGGKAIGGWGPYLGDDGSGAMMGQQALRAVVRDFNGWGPNTLITSLIKEEWNIKNNWDLVPIIQGSPAPFRKIGSVTHIIGKAAQLGDATALQIIKDAAKSMADQTITLFKRFKIPEDRRDIALFGGAWKVDPLMANHYAAIMSEYLPGINIIKPIFEPVCGGLVLHLLRKGFPSNDIQAILYKKMGQYLI